MGDVNHEPTMEEILASIKKIIAEDGETALAERTEHPHAAETVAEPAPETVEEPVTLEEPETAEAPAEDILELTEAVEQEEATADPLISDDTAETSRAALAALSAMSGPQQKSEAGGSQALEELVRGMLRPMLKEWLDQNLPGMVEEMVAKEIARIANIGE